MAECTIKIQKSEEIDFITSVILDNSIIAKFGTLINKFLQKIDSKMIEISLVEFVNEEAEAIENILVILTDILSFEIKPNFQQSLINWNIYTRVHALLEASVRIIQEFSNGKWQSQQILQEFNHVQGEHVQHRQYQKCFAKFKSLLIKSISTLINACDTSALAPKDILKMNVFKNTSIILDQINHFSIQAGHLFQISKS